MNEWRLATVEWLVMILCVLILMLFAVSQDSVRLFMKISYKILKYIV